MEKMDIASRATLAVMLSKLEIFQSPDQRLEQYATDSEVAATALWDAYMKGDIQGRVIADLGAGTGILGIGALMLGAKKVIFVEKDDISTLQRNLGAKDRAIVMQMDISDFSEHCDVVIENPPFGTQDKHADRLFLKKAFFIAPIVYSFHKSETIPYLEGFAKQHGFSMTGRHDFSFPLKKTLAHHKKSIHRIDVTCARFAQNI
jgi:putative methylase